MCHPTPRQSVFKEGCALLIRDIYRQSRPAFSFEFFPPKTDDAESELFDRTVPELLELRPSFFSVTYGAGGGTRDKTLRITATLKRRFGIEAMSHLTCSGTTQDAIARYLDEAREAGIENILALRGDPPKGEEVFRPTEGGFRYAVDLIRFVKARGFCVGAACYPEGHAECHDKQKDWDHTVAKVQAGADFLISQLFYDWNDFLEMEAYLREKGVQVPIVPGILPFLSANQIRRFTSLCGAVLPEPINRKLDELGDDDEAVRRYGVDVCTEICRQAIAHGVAGIHFYCLNRSRSCKEIFANLGLS